LGSLLLCANLEGTLGRKNKYETNVKPNLFLVENWARDGDSEEMIAKKLDVAYSTFRKYKEKYSALSAALKKNKETADYEVVERLHDKCMGILAKEKKAFKCKRVFYDDKDRRCEEEYIQTAEVETYIPPDTMAMAIWLNNRMPDKWRRNANKEKLDEAKFKHVKEKDDKKDW